MTIILILFYAYRVFVNNNKSLNSERRQAAYGLYIKSGWGKWEKWKGVTFRHRWINKTAHITVRREDLIVGIPIVSSYPNLADQPQNISFYINGVKTKQVTLDKPGEWKLIQIPAPYADAFIHTFPFRVSIRIEVDKTWIPKKTSGDEDVRDLGITVGEFRWLTPKNEMGGWYNVAFDRDKPFWWSGKYGWRKIVVGPMHEMKIPFSAMNILLNRWPLDVAVYFNGEYCDTITLRTKGWINYTYPISKHFETGSTGIVEFISSRTWIPKQYGFSDSRVLGVAVGEITAE